MPLGDQNRERSKQMSRLQIDVTNEQLKDIEALMEKCQVTTKKDLFNNAFVLLDWAVGEKENGNTIASINEETERYRELLMPILNNVAKKNERKRSLAAARG